MATWKKIITSGSSAELAGVSSSHALVPIVDNGADLGSTGLEWKDLYIDGTANIDSLVADTADINGGTIDGITSLTAGGNLDIGSHDLRAATLTADGLTSGRVIFAGTNGVLSDDSDFTFATDTLTVTKIKNASSVSDTQLTGSFSGSFTGTFDGADDLVSSDGTGADNRIAYWKGGSSELQGSANLQFDDTHILIGGGGKVQFRDAGDEYIYSVSDGTLGIAAGTEIDLTATNIDINGAVDISGNTVIGGNLTVNGTTTTVATTNTEVKDQFLFIASGSQGTNVDAGIIVQSGSAAGSGSALYHDNSTERWAVAKSIGKTNTAATTHLQFVSTIKTSTSAPSTSDADYGVGEMWVDTDDQEIYIRTS
jgi:hypothetical protein